MIFQTYIPAAPLSEFVVMFWYVRQYVTPTGRERVLPMTTSELVINLSAAFGGSAIVSGPRSESLVFERSAADELLGVHFHSGGLFPFLTFPLHELHGRNISLADIWGQAANELIERLQGAGSIRCKFRVLERWLIRRAHCSLQHHPAIAFALKAFETGSGQFSSAFMAERVGFSQRHFIRTFREEVGLAPKLFCRLQRFQQVIQEVGQRAEVDWSDLALANGYCDQAHLNNEFREFSGLTPTEYLALRTRTLNHVQA